MAEAERSIVGPIASFKKVLVIDRNEIEGYRTLRNLIVKHLDQVAQGRVRRPLSLAVFGPPGAGKSFAVKNIIASIDRGDVVEALPTNNLAQFTRTEDLDKAFQRIQDSITEDRVPIAFFDEFDCEFSSQELAWLKFFLSPMEDGEYKGRPVKKAIFVFAGGTSQTFADFSREDSSITETQRAQFSEAKGPDFVSRLRGHLDVLGINPNEPADEMFIVRRAILLRAFVSDQQNLKDGDRARIDTDLLRALLHAPHYKHGGRSMRMVVDLCAGPGGALRNSFLPTLAQLNMHVDGQSFLETLKRRYSPVQ